MDTKVTLQDLKQEVEHFVQERDWQQFHSGKNLAIAIACEAAELLEKFQWIELSQSSTIIEKDRAEVEHELADIIIAILCFCNRYSIDISSAVLRKLDLTKTKYPAEKVKGSYEKYTKYK